MDDLTRRVVRYQISGTDFAMVYAQITTIVYRFPQRNSRCTEDDCGDFLLFFQARINTVVKRFCYRGISFEAYLLANLKWQLRTYLRRRDHSCERVRVALRPLLWTDTVLREDTGLTLHQAAPPFAAPLAAQKPRIRNPRSETDRRRLLIIVLKACLYVREAELPLIALALSCDTQWLRECWLRLRLRLICRRSRSEELVTRRNRLYVTVYGIHHQLSECSDEENHSRLYRELQLLQQRLARVRCQLSRVPHAPTNLEISEVTGIPKGTVDSSLYYAKRKLRQQLALQ